MFWEWMCSWKSGESEMKKLTVQIEINGKSEFATGETIF